MEKQSKGQSNRIILIKGSTNITRLANTWISAIIASLDRDPTDIVGRQQYKTLTRVSLAKTSSAVVVTKTVAKRVLTRSQGEAGIERSKRADIKKGQSELALDGGGDYHHYHLH